jgi:hypothetical protein
VVLKALKKNPIFQFLASLKLAVILLVTLAIILSVATFYESIYDTKTAQYLVYRSPLFALFLGFLGINLTASALMRYPWKKAQTGFVVTHLGIILVLIGSLVTMFKGLDGTMALEEGESSAKVTIDQPVLYFGRDLNTISEIQAEYRWNRPVPGKSTHRYPLEDGSGLVAVIDDYYHHAQADTIYVPDTSGLPALELRLHNANVDQKVWLTPSDGKITMGAAQLELYRLPDEAAVKAFLKPAELYGRGSLQILIKDQPLVLDLDRLNDTPYPIDVEGASLRLLRYLPHAVVENGELISRDDDPVNPAVEVELSNAAGSQKWLLFSALPELNTRLSSTGKPLEARILYNRPEQPQERTLEVGLASNGKLYYRIDGKRSGELLDTPLETGWMNLKAEKVTFLEKGRREKLFKEIFPKKGTEDKAPGPAIRLTLEGSKQPDPVWLQRGDIRKLPDAEGKDIIIGYGYKTVPLDFDVTLKEFRIGYDPGTQTAASYESDVTIGDKEYTIAMNEPYEKDGVKVFQASFAETPDGKNISVFSVARDPGIELKYLGSILLVLGIIIQFYFKPRKTRRPKTKEPLEEAPLV